MAEHSSFARWRQAVTPVEVLGVVSLAGLVIVAVMYALVGISGWLTASAFLFAGLLGMVALLAARRSHEAVRRSSAELEASARRWRGKLKQRAKAQQQTGAGLPAAAVKATTSKTAAPAQSRKLADSGVLANYVRLGKAKPDGRWLDETVLRNASVSGRDLLAFAASGAEKTYQGLARELVSARIPATRKRGMNRIKRLDADCAMRLARVLALQNLYADDRINALTLYRCLYDIHGPEVFRQPRRHARVFQQLAYAQGEFVLADKVVRRVRCAKAELPAMRADLLNPFTESPYADTAAWLEQFNHYFAATGVESVQVGAVDEHAPRPAFDRLRCGVAPVDKDGPLVTVVVSTWKPDSGLFTALESLRAQSYRNIEILVVDDGSPQEYLPIYEQVEALDERIRVLRQPFNAGTYVARNRALDEARGRFMTFLDSDDWSHPRRIEMQVDALLENDALVCTTTWSLLVHANLVFNEIGKVAQRENPSSIMFRVGAIREHVGYFDRVRKGADTEFVKRLRRIFGETCHQVLERNLGLIRLSPHSLSRKEFKPGWWHPSRSAYRRSYEHWHAAWGPDTGKLKTTNHVTDKTCPAPRRFAVSDADEDAPRSTRFDIVFVGDFRHGNQVVRGTLDEALACRRQGMRVGILHLESFRHLERVLRLSFWKPMADVLANGELVEVQLTDAVMADTVVIRDPEVLQFVNTQPSALDVGRVIVVAPYPSLDQRKRQWFEPSTCHRHAQALFAAGVSWIPVTEDSRRNLEPLLPKSVIIDGDWPMIVSTPSGEGLGSSRSDGSIVVGRIVNTRGRFAKSVVLRAAYPRETVFSVRMLGVPKTIRRCLGGGALPGNWSVHDECKLTHDAFLRACDFYVSFTGPDIVPAASRDVLEAMATGCIVLTSPDHADIYGDAAVYCEPVEVADTLRRLHADPTAADQTRAAAKRLVTEVWGDEHCVQSMKRLLRGV